jgi:hypothetical protein
MYAICRKLKRVAPVANLIKSKKSITQGRVHTLEERGAKIVFKARQGPDFPPPKLRRTNKSTLGEVPSRWQGL